MSASELSRAQLERKIAQSIQNFYRERIGQRPSKAVCQFFDDTLTIVLRDTVAPAERTLLEAGREEHTSEFRVELHQAIKPELKALLEEIVGTSIITVLIDSDLETGFSNITAILKDAPSVRDPESIPKVKKDKVTNGDNGR
jgi:uncharacterized protein YbcI